MNKKLGRPTKYDPSYCEQADTYLERHQDEFWSFLKTDGDKSQSFERMVTVKLPTIRGFALELGVQESTLYEWAKHYSDFSKSLEKIKHEQESRLLNHGLSGEYNSTIAKLILSSNHGYKERNDTTTDDKPLPQPIIHVRRDNSDTENQSSPETN